MSEDEGWTTVHKKVKQPKQKTNDITNKNNTDYYIDYNTSNTSNTNNNYDQVSFQDWKTITFRKKPKPTKVLTDRHDLATDKSRHLSKIDRQEDPQIQKVNPNLSKKIQEYRNKNQLNQTELAHLMNVPLNILKNYENGKANHDIQITQKINFFMQKNPTIKSQQK